MIDKQHLVKTLEEMVERRANQPSHLTFYTGPQKSIVEDILLRVKHGEFDVKESKPEDKQNQETALIRTYGCWSPYL